MLFWTITVKTLNRMGCNKPLDTALYMGYNLAKSAKDRKWGRPANLAEEELN